MWRSFFEELGFEVVVSPNTNKKILDMGINSSIDESCTSAKVFMGHVEWLIGKCDFIFVPRVVSFEDGDATCTKFYGIYDIVRATFPDAKFLHYNIDYDEKQTERKAYLKLGRELGAKNSAVKTAYENAVKALHDFEKNLEEKQEAALRSEKIKVLIVAHPYNIYDKLMGEPIVTALENLGASVLYADIPDSVQMCNKSRALARSMYWRYNKELTGAVDYYKDKVDGIIFMTTFPCGPDSLAIELIMRKIKNIPMTNLIIDSNFGEAGLHTRIESFIDILYERQKINILPEGS
jgi:predicted nucleotide-binding protein (sugar kinase/HSP70/actin superfamily)